MFCYSIILMLMSVMIMVPLLLSVAFFTLAESKVMASIQRRKGPNVVGFGGLLQPFADGLKLIMKEIVMPMKADKFLFILAPLITMYTSLLSWPLMPFSPLSYNNFSFILADYQLPYGVLYIFAVSSLGVYGVVLSGWASNSKYPLLGSIRSAAQMMSYEITMGFVFLIVVLVSGSLNLYFMVESQGSFWFVLLLFPVFIIFLMAVLAETNSAPFDLPEAEAELVAGFNLEYSGILFAFFFLGEYSNMLLMSALVVVMFLGGWYLPLFKSYIMFPEFIFSLKLCIVNFFYVWVRATFPRYSYDQLMHLGWKYLLPLMLGLLFFYSGLLISVDVLCTSTLFSGVNNEFYLCIN